jgi:hypothetical protein
VDVVFRSFRTWYAVITRSGDFWWKGIFCALIFSWNELHVPSFRFELNKLYVVSAYRLQIWFLRNNQNNVRKKKEEVMYAKT